MPTSSRAARRRRARPRHATPRPSGADRCSPARRASAGPERGPAPAVTRRRAGGTRSFREPPTYGSAPRRATCISPSSGSAQSRPAGGGPSAGHRHLIPDRVAIQYPLAAKGIPHRWQIPGRRRGAARQRSRARWYDQQGVKRLVRWTPAPLIGASPGTWGECLMTGPTEPR